MCTLWSEKYGNRYNIDKTNGSAAVLGAIKMVCRDEKFENHKHTEKKNLESNV